MPELILDIMIMALLGATIFYCWLLSKRLGHWRRDEKRLREMVADFDAATRRAEAGIQDLRQTGQSIENTLHKRIREARALSDELQFMIENIDSLTTYFDSSSSGSSSQPASPKMPAGSTGESNHQSNRDSRLHREEPESAVKSRAEKELLKALRSEEK